MNIVFMSMDTLPSTLWARDLYDQMHIRSDFRKWFPRMCQYGFIEGRDYEYMPRVRLQDEGGRTVQRYVKDYRITQDMAKKLCKLHHTAVGAAYRPHTRVSLSILIILPRYIRMPQDFVTEPKFRFLKKSIRPLRKCLCHMPMPGELFCRRCKKFCTYLFFLFAKSFFCGILLLFPRGRECHRFRLV